MKTRSQHTFPLLLCAFLIVGLCNCQLANSALKAPATLLKGMGGAASRSIGLSSNDSATEKPAIDAESLRHYRDSVEMLPEVTNCEDHSNLAHTEPASDAVL